MRYNCLEMVIALVADKTSHLEADGKDIMCFSENLALYKYNAHVLYLQRI